MPVRICMYTHKLNTKTRGILSCVVKSYPPAPKSKVITNNDV